MSFEYNFDGRNVKFDATTEALKRLDEVGVKVKMGDTVLEVPGAAGSALVELVLEEPTVKKLASVLFNLQTSRVMDEKAFELWLKDNKGEKANEILKFLQKTYDEDIADESL